MIQERAECGNLPKLLQQLGADLDQYLRFEHSDAMCNKDSWKAVLGGSLPEQGIYCEQLLNIMGQYLIPNSSQVPQTGLHFFYYYRRYFNGRTGHYEW